MTDDMMNGFTDELTKLGAEITEGSTLGNPRELRKSFFRKILERLGFMTSKLEHRNAPKRRRKKAP